MHAVFNKTVEIATSGCRRLRGLPRPTAAVGRPAVGARRPRKTSVSPTDRAQQCTRKSFDVGQGGRKQAMKTRATTANDARLAVDAATFFDGPGATAFRPRGCLQCVGSAPAVAPIGRTTKGPCLLFDERGFRPLRARCAEDRRPEHILTPQAVHRHGSPVSPCLKLTEGARTLRRARLRPRSMPTARLTHLALLRCAQHRADERPTASQTLATLTSG